MKDLLAALDRCAAAGQRVHFWLRDDDAIGVTPALERLLSVAGQWQVPVILAVIPAHAEPALAGRISDVARVRVAVHGFSHSNHAGAQEKKQELGAHRPAETVLDEVRTGRDRLQALFPGLTVPMLIPPWNRIAPGLLPHLPGLGLRYLSTFGTEAPHEPVPGLMRVDCQLDIIDWRTRASHSHETLTARLTDLVRQRSAATAPIGILTHHLVHDDAAWAFLADLLRLTARHDAVTWDWPVAEFAT